MSFPFFSFSPFSSEFLCVQATKNHFYLLYCNIVINTSVGVIAKVNDVFVFNLNNWKKLCWLIFSIIPTIISLYFASATLRKENHTEIHESLFLNNRFNTEQE